LRGGIEALLYVEETFQKLAKKLKYSALDAFDSWELCLGDSALDHWENINNAGDDPADRTESKFNGIVFKFYLRYSSSEARDIVYSYLGSKECIKLKETEVLDHQNRMETLMRYANRLNGVAPEPAASSKLKIIFESFHPTHVMNYKLTGTKLTAATKLDDIIDFMKLQKHNQEMKASQFKRKKGENDENRNSSNKKLKLSRKEANGKPSYGKPHLAKKCNQEGHEMCSKHNFTHTRDHCFDNPHGSRYRGGGSGGRGTTAIKDAATKEAEEDTSMEDAAIKAVAPVAMGTNPITMVIGTTMVTTTTLTTTTLTTTTLTIRTTTTVTTATTAIGTIITPETEKETII